MSGYGSGGAGGGGAAIGNSDHAEVILGQVFNNWIPGALSAYVPWDTDSFKTDASMHDNTVHESGTATGVHSTTSLQDTSKVWSPNQWVGYYVFINAGTAAGRWAKIVSSGPDSISWAGAAWDIAPDNTSQYQISKRADLVIPSDGIWTVRVQVAWSKGPAANTLYGVYIYVNDVLKNIHFNIGSTATEHEMLSTRSLQLNAGDIVNIVLYQGSGGPLQVFGSAFRTWINVSQQVRL